MMTYRTPLALTLAALLSACGGGSGPSGAPSREAARRDIAPDPCAAEVPARLTGDYAGTLTMDATATGGPYCTWATAVTINGRASGGECALSAAVTADVEQGVFPDAGTAGAAECSSIPGVELDLFGVEAQGDGTISAMYLPADAPNAGPYSADRSATVPYLNPLSGTVPLVDRLVLGADGVLRPEQVNVSVARPIEGRLERVR